MFAVFTEVAVLTQTNKRTRFLEVLKVMQRVMQESNAIPSDDY
jgi:hypothetical protein